MYLNKKEMEALYWLLYWELYSKSHHAISVGCNWEKWLEIERNVFRKLKKKLKKKISEEEAIRLGLVEEVSKETLEKYAQIDSDKPLISRLPISIMATLLLNTKSKTTATTSGGYFYFRFTYTGASLSIQLHYL
jgi:hypothetical protein